MKRILAVLSVVSMGACVATTTTYRTAGSEVDAPAAGTGAATPRAAVDMFFRSMKDGDVQAVSAVWGSKKGSSRETINRDELETRIIVMQTCLAADEYRVMDAPFQKRDSAFYKVEIKKGGLQGTTDVVAVTGPDSRWYVAQADLPAVAPLCRR